MSKQVWDVAFGLRALVVSGSLAGYGYDASHRADL
jgi:hypothetical protein